MPLGTVVSLGLRNIALNGDPAPPPLNGTAPNFWPNDRCGQTAGWTKMPLGMEVDLGPGDFVFDGDPTAPEKKTHPPPPNFWPISIVAKRLDGSLGTQVNFGPGDVVLDVVAAPPKRGTAFSVHINSGQTAGRMKTPLATDVDLGPGHIVFEGVPSQLSARGSTPSFRPMFMVAIDMGRKEGAAVPLSWRAGSPCNTMWPRPKSTSVPSGVFIHPAVWPQ